MSIVVYEVGEADDEVVRAVRRLLPQLSSATPPDAPALAEMLGHDSSTLFLARSGQDILGMLTLVTFPLATGLRARIEDVVVDEAARGKGVGAELTRAALRAAAAAGARTVDLTSRPDRESANRLYRRLGFEARDSVVYRHLPKAD
ncbi:GNAT family N-acetyltransferase [Streptomyces boninensis]|uniref:GNAT family N-acetyltransferase n=1 Tax=Streptomyces boninensis TaxID=2039455 RepID=UPI003B212A9A